MLEKLAYISEADVLNHLRIEIGLANHLLADLENKSVESRVLEPAFESLTQSSSHCKCYHDVIGVFLLAFMLSEVWHLQKNSKLTWTREESCPG